MEWKSPKESELAGVVRAHVEHHLDTYELNLKRLHEDVRHESSILEAAYRHRQVIELVQNGADAMRAEPGGRIAVTLSPTTLYVANSGTPLTPAGAESLLYLGLSEKVGKEIGRLGVGFKSVLDVTSSPLLLSRSVSMQFDEALSRQRIEARIGRVEGPVPVMRIAEVVDPHQVGESDSIVAEMMKWAASVVVLPLRDGCLEWLAQTFSPAQFRAEFLLFSSQVGEVNFVDLVNANERRISRGRGDGLLRLSDSAADDVEAAAEWMVRTRSVALSDDAKRDGGERFGREEVELAWAVPQTTPTGGRRARELWSFFPVTGVASSLPGILNTAWKLSEDRGNVVAGTLNEELVDAAAELIIESLPSCGIAARPGAVLDLLPPVPQRYGSNTTGWIAPLIQNEVWRRAAGAEILPSESGQWRVGEDLRLWPTWANTRAVNAAVAVWREAVVDPGAWVHRSVMTEDRIPKARELGAAAGSTLNWVEALRNDRDRVDSSGRALRLVLELSQVALGQDEHNELLLSEVVATSSGGWARVRHVQFGDEADPEKRAHETVEDLVRAIHARFEISADVNERVLLSLATAPQVRQDWSRFWTLAHRMPTGRAAEVLSAVPDLSNVHVRSRSGEFQPRSSVLRPGPIVDGVEDLEFTLDLDFHREDEAILQRIGIDDVALIVPRSTSRMFAAGYRTRLEDRWRARQAEAGRSTPQSGSALFRPTAGKEVHPGGVDLVSRLTVNARQRWTLLLMQHPHWDADWTVAHRTQRHKYGADTVESPFVWAIKEMGALESSLGRGSVRILVGTDLQRWAAFLPVVSGIDSSAQSALGLPQNLAGIDPELASRAIGNAQLVAARDETAESVAFLRAMADAGWVPTRPVTGTAISSRLPEVLSTRAEGRIAWLCERGSERGWPTGWDLRVIEAVPAHAHGELEDFMLREYFPAMADRLENSDWIAVRECDRVTVSGVEVDFARNGDAFIVDRRTDWRSRRFWFAEELFPHLDPDQRAVIVEADQSASAQSLILASSEATSDIDRLVILCGESKLRLAVHRLLPRSPFADVKACASALLTVYGTSVLRELREDLPEELGAPVQWAGGERVVAFVRRLGFGPEYAGRRKSERPDSERVYGPAVSTPLHPFQVEIAEHVEVILNSRSRGVIDLPTGAGKTRVAIESVINHARSVGRLGTVLWLAEREELCEQAVTQWMQLWRAFGIPDQELSVLRYWGGRWPGTPDASAAVVVATRQQLHGRLSDPVAAWLQAADLVVVDEAHHSTASTYLDILKWRASNDSVPPPPVLGLSATPFRSDAERSAHLARLFDKSLVSGSLMGESWKERIKWLQQERYLSVVEPRSLGRGVVEPTESEVEKLIAEPNLSTGIDRINERLGEDEDRNSQLVKAISEMDSDWPVVVFAASVPHAQVLATLLVEAGIPSRPIWGNLSQWARRHAIEEFRSRRIRVLTNFNVLSEGFDAPQTRAVVVARLVRSDGLFLQMLGRGMRGPKNGGTDRCDLVTTGERLPDRFDADGQLDIERFDYLWNS